MGKNKQGAGGDPLERLGAMIDEKINAAFNSRDQAAREEKDPWARIEGMIDRAVGKHFAEFRRGLEESDDEPQGGDQGAGGRRPRGEKPDDGDGGVLRVLGLG